MQLPNLPVKTTQVSTGNGEGAGSNGASEADGASDGAFTAMMRLMAFGGSKQSGHAASGQEGTPNADPEKPDLSSALVRLLGMKSDLRDASEGSTPDASSDGAQGDASPETTGSDAGAAAMPVSIAQVLAQRIASAASGRSETAQSALRHLHPSAGQGGASLVAPSVSAAAQGEMAAQGEAAGEVDTLFSRFAVKPEAVSERKGETGGASGRRITADSVDIVRQETHFAPSMRIPPIQQVGEAVSRTLTGGEEIPNVSRFTDPGLPNGQSSGPTVKILEIKLQPEELGTVRVTMRIVDDRLEVDVRSANEQTVELLEKDRHMLDRMLRAAGHKADSITIHGMTDDRSPFQVTTSPNTQNAGQQPWQGNAQGDGQPGGAANGQGRGGAEGEGRRPGDHSSNNGDGTHGPEEQAYDRRGDGGALYL